VPKQVVQQRYDRLIELQEQISWTENKKLLGTEVEVLVSSFEGKKDAANLRVSGRARDGRLVHVAPAELAVGPGDLLTTQISYAAPHHLVADGPVLEHRPWRGTGSAAPAPVAPRPLLSIGRAPKLG
jgi:tRNA-2-methylthio-N6-dimethylallyladenosine synthase